MIAQYSIVGILVLIAVIYTVFKFSNVLKGKDSSCTSCKGCDLQNMKSPSEKADCAETKNADSDTDK